MTTLQKKTKIKKYIEQKADERFLNIVYAIMEADTNLIVGYTADGKPLTRQEAKERLKKAEARINKGQYITQDELEKEAANW